MEKERNKKKRHTHYSIDISKQYQYQLTHGPNSAHNLRIQKILSKKPSTNHEVNVPWNIERLRKEIIMTISPRLYGWYEEESSSCGNSTRAAVQAFSQMQIIPQYLTGEKPVTLTKKISLSSKALGTTTFLCPCPFFTAPYGCASEYGGSSDEIHTLIGTLTGGGIYTIACFTKYSVEYLSTLLKEKSVERDPFFMFQLYVTGDNDINISLIERAKACGVSVIIITIDTGANNHGGIGLIEYQSDLTYERHCYGNLLQDPVFNIKCYQRHRCVGTRDPKVLEMVAKSTGISCKQLLTSFHSQRSLDYAKQIQSEGMGHICRKTSTQTPTLSLEHFAALCHSSRSLCPYMKRDIKRGVPLVIKGCVSVRDALEIQAAGVDGVYVSNHGGRFSYNCVPPLRVIRPIRMAVKRQNPNFGVWFDGGVRNGQDILIAYSQGAELVGVGRPIIYAGVLYGEAGVSSVTKKLRSELEGQCQLCGQTDVNQYDRLKSLTQPSNNCV